MQGEEKPVVEDVHRHNARVSGWFVEIVPSARFKCTRCKGAVPKGTLRLVMRAKEGRYLKKIGYCFSCSQDIIEKWEQEMARVADLLKRPAAPICFMCSDWPPMEWKEKREINVPGKTRSIKRKIPAGWQCPNGHRHTKFRQWVWPPRKRML